MNDLEHLLRLTDPLSGVLWEEWDTLLRWQLADVLEEEGFDCAAKVRLARPEQTCWIDPLQDGGFETVRIVGAPDRVELPDDIGGECEIILTSYSLSCNLRSGSQEVTFKRPSGQIVYKEAVSWSLSQGAHIALPLVLCISDPCAPAVNYSLDLSLSTMRPFANAAGRLCVSEARDFCRRNLLGLIGEALACTA